MINKRKWSIYGSVALFHGVMIWFYQVPLHDPAKANRALPASPVVMAAGTSWDPLIKKHPLVRNPLLMAQANERGFTSELWNKSFKSPNPYSDWGESPRYLTEPKAVWGKPFLQFSDQTSAAMWKPIGKPKAELDEPLPPTPFAKALPQMQFSPNLEDRLPDVCLSCLYGPDHTPLLQPTFKSGLILWDLFNPCAWWICPPPGNRNLFNKPFARSRP